MLFDLRGKRRRMIQVIYACLAILMGGSLVLFGIGSDAPGGILDGLGIGDGTGPQNPQYEQQVETAEEQLATDPDNQEALLTLARYRYLMATDGVSVDPETGERDVTTDARENLERAHDAWERYLETDPSPPDPGLARNISQANEILFSEALRLGDVRGALDRAEATAQAARVAVRQDPTAPEFGNMARYLYIAGEDREAEQALERAVSLVEGGDREQIRDILEQQARQAQRLHRQLNQALEEGGPGTEAIEDPFGPLGQPGPAPAP